MEISASRWVSSIRHMHTMDWTFEKTCILTQVRAQKSLYIMMQGWRDGSVDKDVCCASRSHHGRRDPSKSPCDLYTYTVVRVHMRTCIHMHAYTEEGRGENSKYQLPRYRKVG